MKKFFVFVAVLAVPVLLLLTASQSATYYFIEKSAFMLEKEQLECVEENRKLLGSIASASSRERVGSIVKELSDYEIISPKTTLRIQVEPVEKLDG